jgi:uncharacterized delta-60 repeat protein
MIDNKKANGSRFHPLVALRRLAIALSTALLALPANATSGDLDTRYAFPNPGFYQSTRCFANSNANTARSVVIQSDSKIVMVGYTTATLPSTDTGTCIMRLSIDGVLDTSFNPGFGYAGLNTSYKANAVALQPDGKIVAVGSNKQSNSNTDFFIERRLSTGLLDPTFGSSGTVIINSGTGLEEATSVAVQPDGAIVVAGYCVTFGSNFCTYRITPSGGLDSTFGTNGRVDGAGGGGATPSSVLIQPDGKIVVVGGCFLQLCVDRYNPNGSPDITFGGAGSITGAVFSDIGTAALQGDGGIVVATSCLLPASTVDSGFCPTRINKNGTIDSLMGSPITAFSGYSSIARGIVVQDDGNVVIAGQCTSTSDLQKKFCVARYNSDGSADRTFNADGRTIVNTGLGNSEAYAIAVQVPDARGSAASRLVVVGGCEDGNTTPRFCSVRLLDSGRLNRRCSLDVDGDGVVTTQDTLLAMRFALGFRDTALIAGINFTNRSRSNVRETSSFFKLQCGM